ncbi:MULTISPECIES: sensor histidine kinase [Pseudomonadaceae]|uniref:histidine kinase n=1 Tax=Pseudomonas denitrificans TaxID=43306 RepID=A0A9X7MWM7_PSEDE|nr:MULTISPECIES: HAMP domain-containing sensor histidine kinase [Pseudomonadaceae]MBD9516814.1 HAMP domain-containing histidine kinase [Pseudomonas sp. PDM22]MBD9628548.1 HAMP domain-containing histidine kinase [Pseudomonas sp. PDM19]QEY70773.1 HAMP domain-containing histidine kinase [Pseudomonas denitrificans (nom. rej.)]
MSAISPESAPERAKEKPLERADSLFARLFGVFLLAIVVAHLLAFAWFHHYGPHRPDMPPPPPPGQGFERGPPPQGFAPGPEGFRPPPPPPPRLPFWSAPFAFQLLALILAAGIGARLLARPVQRMGDAALRLSEDLDSPPLPETGPREARQAAHAFNRMRERIREQVQQRSRMLVAVSHDLRTPLSRLRLRVEEIDNPQLRTRIGQDLAEMIGMLDSTLHYLQQERATEPLQWFDVKALADSLAEDACERGADVGVEGFCAPLKVQPMALRSCLNNLLDNALRYAGDVSIELRDGTREVEIRVRDHGPGIPSELREQVFEPFFRLEGSRNRNSGGVGLGLSIARDAARRQGGDLTFEETPGGGATAVLRLPRSAAT